MTGICCSGSTTRTWICFRSLRGKMGGLRDEWWGGGGSFVRRRAGELGLSAPSFGWLVVLFAVPTVLVLVISFRKVDPYGGMGGGWSLEAWRALANPSYPKIFARTIWLSALAAAICILLALPIAYAMGRATPRVRSALLLVFIVPFWTNFLIRVFAWRQLLHPAGFLREGLVSLGVIEPDTLLLYNSGAVLLVIVYTYLPFAILPLYAVAEKFDFGLIDAARDLGASGWRSFWGVFVPGVGRGIAVAAVMVFVPGLGSYVIPDLVGGPSAEMLGNKIAQRVFTDRNLPHAAALSAVLILVTVAMLGVVYWVVRKRKGGAA